MNSFAVHRGIFGHPIVGPKKPFSHFEAWTWLLAEAAWKPRRYAAGQYVREMERGQLVHSTRYMAKAWGWPETNVRRFLRRLKTGAMIGAETGAGITIITVCNYDLYQFSGAESGAPNGAANGAKVAHKWRRKEEGNKEIKDIPSGKVGKNPLDWPADAFEQWYAAYPKHVDRKDAERAFARVRSAGEISHDGLHPVWLTPA